MTIELELKTSLGDDAEAVVAYDSDQSPNGITLKITNQDDSLIVEKLNCEALIDLISHLQHTLQIVNYEERKDLEDDENGDPEDEYEGEM